MEQRPMVVTHEGGLKFATQIRGHRVVVDQPERVGNDEGPMPLELLGASLGSCVALYVKQFSEARGIPYEGMEVEVRQVGARNPGRVGTFDVRVVMPEEIPSEYAGLLERVARSCPAHHTLSMGAEVAVRIEQEERAAA